MTDVLGRETDYTRNGSGFVTREDLPDATYREWGYNSFNVVNSYRDERGEVTDWDHDTAGHMTGFTDAENNEWVYTYSSSTGLLDTITDPVGKVTTVTWDGYRRKYTEVVTHGSTVLSDPPR